MRAEPNQNSSMSLTEDIWNGMVADWIFSKSKWRTAPNRQNGGLFQIKTMDYSFYLLCFLNPYPSSNHLYPTYWRWGKSCPKKLSSKAIGINKAFFRFSINIKKFGGVPLPGIKTQWKQEISYKISEKHRFIAVSSLVSSSRDSSYNAPNVFLQQSRLLSFLCNNKGNELIVKLPRNHKTL